MIRKALFMAMGLAITASCSSDDDNGSSNPPDYLPDITQAVFTNSTDITNPFYGPDAGKVYIYEAREVGMDPEEEIRIERLSSTKNIMGITCIIQRDRAYLDGILIEDTEDWLAQDDDENLWYMGEFVKNYDDEGNFKNNDGSFEYGMDGALPGYWLPADPLVGQRYGQEYYRGEAEDEAEVIGLDETVTMDFGTFTGCLVTRDENPLEPDEYEIKYYAPSVGFILAEVYSSNGNLIEIEELVEIIE